MVTAEHLAARRDVIGASADLRALADRLSERARPLIDARPVIPPVKALLSQDGGVCATDGAPLRFDPWSPDRHECRTCHAVYRGERHDRDWARFQHLWLAERAAHLATLAAVRDDQAAAARAREILRAYGERYFTYPNRDNVLGPARLFFSTYLESIFVARYLAGATLLRAAGALDDATARAVTQLADEAANLIGEFNEGWSNRQVWHNTALLALATWFEDAELLRDTLERRTGVVAHLLEAFLPDGTWWEGENYHLFALQGLVEGLVWARAGGADVLADEQLHARFAEALLAPARSALPDLTFPARRDSRFAVSLAQPMHVETWEVGLALLAARRTGDGGSGEAIASWLHALHAAPAPALALFDSYLHDVEPPAVPRPPSRSRLSSFALLEMLPALPDAPPWRPASHLFPEQGLAVLRAAERYVSLECGPHVGGHGHPDRLHVTLHDGRTHWLADPGTGSYVSPELLWYRSTLAHNAPRLDGVDQPARDAACVAFDAGETWAWVVGRWQDVTRTVVSGPTYVIDVVELSAAEEHVLELPWHAAGEPRVESGGRWSDGSLAGTHVSDVAEFVPADADAPIVVSWARDGAILRAWLVGAPTLVRALGPGRPGAPRAPFVIARVRGRNARLLAVLASGAAADTIRAVRWSGDLIEIETPDGTERHSQGGASWTVAAPERVTLGGPRAAPLVVPRPFELEHPERARGAAFRIADPPALDGSLDGFDTAEPLTLDLEDQYRRTEEAWSGPDDFAAVAWANWDSAALYLAIEVIKADLWFRARDAAPLRLDNETDDIHSDGVQVYVRGAEGMAGWLVVPEEGQGVRVAPVSGTEASVGPVRGRWARTAGGYRITLGVPWPAGAAPHPGAVVGFDLLVNEMYASRQRRAGQLVWSGGNGWAYLRGDRQDPERLGMLELVG